MYTKLADFMAGRLGFVMLYDEYGKPAFLLEMDKLSNSNTHLIQEYALDGDDSTYRALINKYIRNYYGEYKEPDRKPKGTGGKKPYVMLMTKNIQELRKKFIEDKISNYNEIIGYLINLSEHMDWNTGKLIDKRQRLKKKQLPLKYNDLIDISGYSKAKFENIFKVMKNYKLLWYSEEENKGYFISTIYFKKGKKGVVE